MNWRQNKLRIFVTLAMFSFLILHTSVQGSCKYRNGRQDCSQHDGSCKPGGSWYECPEGTNCSPLGYCGGDEGGHQAHDDHENPEDEGGNGEPNYYDEPGNNDIEVVEYAEEEPQPRPEPRPRRPRPRPTAPSRPKKLFMPWGQNSYFSPPFYNTR